MEYTSFSTFLQTHVSNHENIYLRHNLTYISTNLFMDTLFSLLIWKQVRKLGVVHLVKLYMHIGMVII